MSTRATILFARRGYLLAVLAIAVSTAIFLPGRDVFAKGQWALLYLLVILLVASFSGTGPAVLAAVLAFFAWNFFFLPPYHTLQIRDPKDWLSLVAFLVVGVSVGALAGRMREREARALAREHETAALNRLSAAAISETTAERVAQSGLDEVVDVLGAPSAILFLAVDGDLRLYCQAPAGDGEDSAAADEARRVFRECTEPVPRGDATSLVAGPAAQGGLTVPVRSPAGVSGVVTVRNRLDGRPYSAGDARLVASLSNLVGAFLERERLQAMATRAAAEREADQLKSSLLSSVSHELKTPLAALTATVSNLLESDVDWDARSVRDELQAIVADVTRLNNSIGALLELSRLEAHAWEPRRELYELSDILAAAIETLPAHLRRRVRLDLPDESPIVNVDFVQMRRVIQNLLENALLYTGDESLVTVGGRAWNEGTRLWVEDQGPGMAEDEHEMVFEKFCRGRAAAERRVSGTGIGLAIAREIVHGHGGSIRVEDVRPHGARLVIALPIEPGDAEATSEEA